MSTTIFLVASVIILLLSILTLTAHVAAIKASIKDLEGDNKRLKEFIGRNYDGIEHLKGDLTEIERTESRDVANLTQNIRELESRIKAIEADKYDTDHPNLSILKLMKSFSKPNSEIIEQMRIGLPKMSDQELIELIRKL
jgi:predicted nuclease with TOPRIM domain